MLIRAGVGDGSAGRTATDSRARSGATGADAEQILREGLAIADVRDRADIADRLADVCEEQGRGEEAAEFRRQAKRSAATVEVSQSVSSAGKVLRQKTQVNFGGAGLPLSEMSNLAAMMRGTSAAPITRQKVGQERAMPLRERQEIQEMLRRLRYPLRLSR